MSRNAQNYFLMTQNFATDKTMMLCLHGVIAGTIKYYITCNTSVIANPFKRVSLEVGLL